MSEQVRESIRVRGVVQGVGFRPFVYRIARRCGLSGHVLNDGRGVLIEAQGNHGDLERFAAALHAEAPPLARVEQVERRGVPVHPGPGEPFTIAASGEAGGGTLIPPDAATCPACLAELRDPANRRHRYAFTNCTDCGPRYTIIEELPYDRPRTTMRRFPMCPACLAEYGDPLDRRFHAEPNACPVCGPQLTLLAPDGRPREATDPLATACALLAAGGLLAVKGLGGYHLACDAASEEAVCRLREAKGRDHKPFAVMARNLEAVRIFAEPAPDEVEALCGPDRPIVLLRKRRPFPLAGSISPGLDSVGVMLPYTPLHHLLLAEGSCPVLVMTSGNRSAEPIVASEEEALAVLGPMVELLLVHDRPIHARADDSVVRVIGGEVRPLRRSRGHAPFPVRLPALPALPARPDKGAAAVLAVGGALKNTLCLAQGELAFLSPHIGDLDHPATRDLLTETATSLQRLLGIRPRLVVHDAHPDYPSTIWARSLGLPALALQHHHAHALSCLAEHRRAEPAVALSLDGTGFGLDGTLWGGELLVVDGLRCRRAGHLRALPMPGGERAVHEPWRMAVAALHACAALAALPTFPGVDPARVQAVARLLDGPGLALLPRSSALGRCLDAAAALLGLTCHAGFEGEGPMRLEDAAARWLAREGTLPPPFPWSLAQPRQPSAGEDGRAGDGGAAPWLLDLLPALRLLPQLQAELERAAAALHATVVAAFGEAALRCCQATGLGLVVLSGGVLQNRLIHEGLAARLAGQGIEVLTHCLVPANDGGLALGQAWAGLLS
ncbi:MAG: carbamoyltransferase HypF, partial [Deltaproteobacteria bacterium]|nr:carbamoyltransferase HypF [Deltaproteobacteria bacterium]